MLGMADRKRRLQALEQDVASHRAELDVTREKLDGLTERVDRQAADRERAIAAIAAFRDELERKIDRISELVAETNRRVAEVVDRLDDGDDSIRLLQLDHRRLVNRVEAEVVEAAKLAAALLERVGVLQAPLPATRPAP